MSPEYVPYVHHLVLLALRELTEKGISPTRKELWRQAKALAKTIGKRVGISEEELNFLITEHKLKYWTKRFIEDLFIAIVEARRPQRLSITKLGLWVSKASTPEEFRQKMEFASNGVCKHCCTENDVLQGRKLVLLTPVMEKAFISSGQILNNIDAVCPVCDVPGFYFVHHFPTLDAFITFYNKAVNELKKYFKEVHARSIP